MRGVFLHVLADALGSVVVIVSALIMWLSDWEYKKYVDPGKLMFVFCWVRGCCSVKKKGKPAALLRFRFCVSGRGRQIGGGRQRGAKTKFESCVLSPHPSFCKHFSQ